MTRALYSPIQLKVLEFVVNNDFFMLINHGSVRSGKTVVDNDIFLMELKRVKRVALEQDVTTPKYILAGSDLGALQRNVLSEITDKYGIEIKLDKHNRFKLFGVMVCCFGHSRTNDLGRIRGMTAYGAYINEGTMACAEVFNEIQTRCSGPGARIIIDTNPDNPEHPIKKDYIDKADGKTIKEFQFRIEDNIFLTPRYVANLKAVTPSGVFYERGINGLWTAGQGAIYLDFDKDRHLIQSVENIKMERYIAGVDWGYKHYGAIVVIGIDGDGCHYLVEETARQLKAIDFWVIEAKRYAAKYPGLKFYCDSARPEYVEALQDVNLMADNANKAVMSGIEAVATLYKNNLLYVVDPVAIRFKQEIYIYTWNAVTGMPVKAFDDVQDAIRYAIYSDQTKSQWIY